MAIARIWRGATKRQDARGYLEYLQKTGLCDFGRTPGNLGALALSRDAEDRTEFLVLSLWDSMDAVQDFAGPDPDKAVFYPDDECHLVDADQTVGHYRLAYWSRAQVQPNGREHSPGPIGRAWSWLRGRDPLQSRSADRFGWRIAGIK